MDTREFRAAMQAMGVELTPEEARRMLVAGDRDRSGSLDFGEFAALVLPKMQNTNGAEKLSAQQLRDIRKIFEKFDADRSGAHAIANLAGSSALDDVTHAGTIDARELRAAMRAMGVELSADEVREMLRRFDKNESNALDFAVRSLLHLGAGRVVTRSPTSHAQEFASLIAQQLGKASAPSGSAMASAKPAGNVDQLRLLRRVFQRFDLNRNGPRLSTPRLHGPRSRWVRRRNGPARVPRRHAGHGRGAHA
jgi:Ca2+-binding EF-hand superfamily protein